MKKQHRALMLAATLAAGAAGLSTAQAAEFRNEVALEWMPGGLANDGRRSRDLSYNREFGNGFALGGSIGYGNVHRAKSDDGLLLLLRGRWRSPNIAFMGWMRPQLGIEYGGTSNVFQTADLAGVFFGVHMEASPELGFTLDYWTGTSHYEAGSVNEKRSVSGVRLGLAFRY
jgi:hypothetical protein